jgi:hypothetical protein
MRSSAIAFGIAVGSNPSWSNTADANPEWLLRTTTVPKDAA